LLQIVVWLIPLTLILLVSLTELKFLIESWSEATLITLGIAAVALLFVLGWVSLAGYVQRLHDLNRSGWWYLMPVVFALVPVVGLRLAPGAHFLFFMILAAWSGDPQENSFDVAPHG
jgi:uncharacterized membrane protein YhaH (DUF805 family)